MHLKRKMLFSIIGLLATLTIIGCGTYTTRIIDYYEIRKYESLPNIDGRNILYCKLAYEGDPYINHIKYAEWNNKLIKLITEENYYYLIIAKRNKLCCGCGDTTLGPLTQFDYNVKLKQLGQIKKLSSSHKF